MRLLVQALEPVRASVRAEIDCAVAGTGARGDIDCGGAAREGGSERRRAARRGSTPVYTGHHISLWGGCSTTFRLENEVESACMHSGMSFCETVICDYCPCMLHAC